MVKERSKPGQENERKSSKLANLLLFNDDFNTFDHVIDSLVKVCNHLPEQAEQCALIVHYKGKCVVKSGDYPEMEHLCDKLKDKGLQASVS